MKRNHPDLQFKGVNKLFKHENKLEFHMMYNDKSVIVETGLEEDEYKVLKTSLD